MYIYSIWCVFMIYTYFLYRAICMYTVYIYIYLDICLSYAQHPPKLRAALFALTFSFSLLTLRSSGVRRALPSFSFGFHSPTLQAKVWRSGLKENLSQRRIPRQHSADGVWRLFPPMTLVTLKPLGWVNLRVLKWVGLRISPSGPNGSEEAAIESTRSVARITLGFNSIYVHVEFQGACH